MNTPELKSPVIVEGSTDGVAFSTVPELSFAQIDFLYSAADHPIVFATRYADLSTYTHLRITYDGTVYTIDRYLPVLRTWIIFASLTTAADPYEALDFQDGITRTDNVITADLSTGVAGGQTVVGGTAAGDDLTLSSTTNLSKGSVLIGSSAYDEANNRLGIATATPSAGLHVASAGALSLPGALLSGVWIATGGTSTTTKPHLLVEPAGTTSTGWSTAGTGLGINAVSGFLGRLVEMKVGGTSKAWIDYDGSMINYAYYSFRGQRMFLETTPGNNGMLFKSDAGAILVITNAAESDFNRMVFGTNNTSGVALKKVGAALAVRLGNDSGDASLSAKSLSLTASTGYNQLNLATTYTPTSSADANGSNGDIAYDADYVYVKVGGSWKRSALSTF